MRAGIKFYIGQLINYAEKQGLISRLDRTYAVNRLLEVLRLSSYEEPKTGKELPLEQILEGILDYAYKKGLIPDNSVTQRDLFDTKLMGLLTPPPSVVVGRFEMLRLQDARRATDYYYGLCRSSDYIRTYRVEKDVRFTHKSKYGVMDITINLSKPEKTPEEIAAARLAKSSGYPQCLLCRENEGFCGTISHPARQNHRLIPLMLDGEEWFLQYSPYVYYNEHCIVLSGEHVPMKISRSTFKHMLDFIEYLPHYFVGSNADLPIVGGSILSHDHMQGGRYEFAMERAPIVTSLKFRGFDDVTAGIIKWPLSVIRLRSRNKSSLVELADKILGLWRGYTDEASFIYAFTNGEPHNTITPIARYKNGQFEMDLVLRNNITTEEHPLGYYHPHAQHHNIKKENIGLIEVMGLAVLPARLKNEMARLAEYAEKGLPIREDAELSKHAEWFECFAKEYDFSVGNALNILYSEIGKTFVRVLEDCGVYFNDEKGFMRFIKICNGFES
ncbi:MAG: UDP-glucose--hexose-1-phosphate uridylyltransferase [Clostridia bacterium]|nr:UDP-glucose--hexose-1-phosphate uridylyltransferase [Clostridia bacterium]